MVIVFFIVLAIRGMTGGDRLALWCLLAALLAMAISDSTFTYLANVANYTSGRLIDTGWVAGTALGLPLLHLARGPVALVCRGPSSRGHRSRRSYRHCCRCCSASASQRSRSGSAITWTTAAPPTAMFGLVALVLVRQAMLAFEPRWPACTACWLDAEARAWLWVARMARHWAPALRLVVISPVGIGTGLDVKWIHHDAPSYRSAPDVEVSPRTHRGHECLLIVTVLMSACTAIALGDLFLLALGS